MKTKAIKKTWIWIAFIMTSFTVSAQTHIGARLGTHTSSTSSTGIVDEIVPMGWQTSPEIGLTIEQGLGYNLSAISGILYSRKGFDMNQSTSFNVLGFTLPVGVTANAHLNYIETPVALKYTIGESKTRGFVMGGLSTSYATSGTIRSQANFLIDINLPDVNINFGDNNFSRWNYAGLVGGGIEHTIGRGKVYADISYKHGLNSIVMDTVVDLDIRNKGFTIGVGYAYSL